MATHTYRIAVEICVIDGPTYGINKYIFKWQKLQTFLPDTVEHNRPTHTRIKFHLDEIVSNLVLGN